MSMISILGRKMILRYLSQDNVKEFQLLQFCKEKYIWFVLLTWSILECARWQLFQSYRRQLIRRDDSETEITTPRRTARPWWWSLTPRRVSLSDPLLDDDIPQWVSDGRQAYHQHSGVSPQRRRRRRQQNDHGGRSWLFFWQKADNGRDDGSVDFASVQEEWASRSEEDPLWWTREEENKVDDDRGDTLSWVTDKDHSGEDILTSEKNESE